ncbi:MAG: hypothetical protein KF819_22275 [Labilithrix sp.]|nr:hypothetical protein [Labilithrix sp.]
MSIAKILPSKPVASEHADAILEIAYLMTAVDGRLGDDELEAYREVVAGVRGKASSADVDALLSRFAGNVAHQEIAERVRAIGPTLPDDLRGLAFKIATALSLVDLDSSRDEEELKDVLIDALGLDDERTDALTQEVYMAFDADA